MLPSDNASNPLASISRVAHDYWVRYNGYDVDITTPGTVAPCEDHAAGAPFAVDQHGHGGRSGALVKLCDRGRESRARLLGQRFGPGRLRELLNVVQAEQATELTIKHAKLLRIGGEPHRPFAWRRRRADFQARHARVKILR